MVLADSKDLIQTDTMVPAWFQIQHFEDSKVLVSYYTLAVKHGLCGLTINLWQSNRLSLSLW